MRTKKRKQDRCCRCGRFLDYRMSPMLKSEVWRLVHPDGDWDDNGAEWSGDMMCLECMEKALGRKVVESDLALIDSHTCHAHHSWWNEKFIRKTLNVGNLRYPLDTVYLELCGLPERS